MASTLRPVIWISNQIGHIDPAYLRRFTYCMQFPVPPRAMRRRIAESHLAPLGIPSVNNQIETCVNR